METSRQRKRTNPGGGADNPLNSAVVERDKSTLDAALAAIQHRDLLLAYQPVVQSQALNRAAFYEAFVRVIDETNRIIPARDFMPMIETTEAGRDLDCATLDMGLKTLSQNPGIRLSVNMSARSIGYSKWMHTLGRHLKKDRTIGERLMLEISEKSVMAVPELVCDFIESLQDKGVAFALDNFGAGDVGLRHFRKFFFDAVKIDGQFVRGIHRDPDNQTLVQALISVARRFDMLIIAESVEFAEDADYLIHLGVDCLQGYLFAPPTVRPHWLADQNRRRA